MYPSDHLTVFVYPPDFADGLFFQMLFLPAVSEADHSHIGGIFQHIHDAGLGPGVVHGRFDAHGIETAGNGFRTEALIASVRPGDAVAVPVKDHADNGCLFLINGKGISFSVRDFYTDISVGCGTAHIFTLRHGRKPPSLQPAVDRLILTPAHKEAEFEEFLVKLIVWIISLGWRDNLGIGIFEYIRNGSLVSGIASGETFYFHHQDAVPHVLRHVMQQLLHGGTILNGFP